MPKPKLAVFTFLFIAAVSASASQGDDVPGDLKEAALRDAACNRDTQPQEEARMSALEIRSGGRELGTIIAVQGACHCQDQNCDTLVYLRNGDGYRLALRERYASLHPMKIVKRGMPSLTGTWEVSAQTKETTVYDWNGREYRPSLCATVIKRGKIPSISQHPCNAPAR